MSGRALVLWILLAGVVVAVISELAGSHDCPAGTFLVRDAIFGTETHCVAVAK